jgi:hypothetical protein
MTNDDGRKPEGVQTVPHDMHPDGRYSSCGFISITQTPR